MTRISILLASCLLISACGTAQKAKYSALEQVGIHKRDILVDRIEKTARTQEQTKQKFQSAYEELAGLIEVDDQGLEKRYKRMAAAVEASEDKAAELTGRVAAVDRVAQDLFSEWERELGQYQSANLKQASERNLQITRNRYQALYVKMQTAQQRVQPVLEVLQDNTLFLKHNLNARAVSSLSGEVLRVQDKVAVLISDMELSIDEARDFVRQMQNK
ncbi:MAG: DUF2959 domain-containing protein [Gammaproteobacteria bacterium]|nr:DUF2959 domain-containing protein [Gammaproteobacteria bacterium]